MTHDYYEYKIYEILKFVGRKGKKYEIVEEKKVENQDEMSK